MANEDSVKGFDWITILQDEQAIQVGAILNALLRNGIANPRRLARWFRACREKLPEGSELERADRYLMHLERMVIGASPAAAHLKAASRKLNKKGKYRP